MKHFFLTIFICCLVSIGQAQQSIRPFDGVPYIFEGEIISSKPYQYPDGRVYYSHIIKIKHVFKGDLKPGTVELLNEQDYEMGDMIVEFEHRYRYRVGMKGTFMCRAFTNSCCPTSKEVSTTNTVRLYTLRLDFFYRDYYASDTSANSLCKVCGRDDFDFKSKKDFYKYLSQNPDLKMPDTVVEEIIPEPVRAVQMDEIPLEIKIESDEYKKRREEYHRHYIDSLQNSTDTTSTIYPKKEMDPRYKYRKH